VYPAAQCLKHLDVPRCRAAIVSVVGETGLDRSVPGIAGDGRDNVPNVEIQDLRVDIDGWMARGGRM
jgi:hypothetical protein